MYLSRFFAVASVILLTGCATTATESVYVTQEKGKLDSYISAGVAYYDQGDYSACLLYTSPSPRDATLSRMPSSA